MKFIRTCVERYIQGGCSFDDPLRGGQRVEIPSAFVYAIAAYRLREFYGDLSKIVDRILSLQLPSGAWLEYAYAEREEKVGYEGVIPTCFALVALAAVSHTSDDARIKRAVQKGAEYLHRSEKNGYFFKASFNKSDVVNTNLFAGFALLQSTSFFPENSFIPEKVKFAAHRSAWRAIRSQFPSGAFPYVSFGQKISYLYHAMATALLGAYAKDVKQPLVPFAFYRGVSFLNRIIDREGAMKWKQANLTDKEGAVWAYAWAYAVYTLSGDTRGQEKAEKHLMGLQGNRFLKGGDFDGRDDLFYTAWTIFALSFSQQQDVVQKATTLGLGYWAAYPCAVYRRIRLFVRALMRKIFRSSLDRGPVEEYDTR